MGERTQYTPGTFSWADLSTTDQDAAKAFYSALFGWEITDMPVGEDAVVLDGGDRRQLGRRDLAASPSSSATPGCRRRGTPTSPSATPTPPRPGPRELGATVHAPPFDVMQAGRMAVIQDPQGAYFLHLAAERAHRARGWSTPPARCAWNELGSPDVDGSAAVLRRAVRLDDDADGGQRHALPGGHQRRRAQPTAASARRCRRARRRSGSSTSPPPTSTPPLATGDRARRDRAASATPTSASPSIAVVQDPQGAVFALYDGRLDD